jgi:hypothetical protein
LRAGQQIAARKNGRNGLPLNGRGNDVTLIGDRAQQRFGQA